MLEMASKRGQQSKKNCVFFADLLEHGKAGRVLCGASWGLLGSTESQRARAGQIVVAPGRGGIPCFFIRFKLENP